MDALPDELLVTILSYVDDVHTLLDAVPLVCKRWQRLGKDPEAWASTELIWQPCSNRSDDFSKCSPETHAGVDESSRILLHAAGLRRVSFGERKQWGRSGPCPYESQRLLAAATRGATAVRQVSINWRWMQLGMDAQGAVGDMFLDLAAMWRRSLRALDLGWMPLSSSKTEATLALLGKLESLDLGMFLMPGHTFESTGATRGKLPRLQRLAIETRVDPRAAGLLADLVGGATGTLRVLHLSDRFHFPPLLPRIVITEVRKCTELRELQCNVADVAVVSNLPQLRWLSLSVVGVARTAQDVAENASALASAASSLVDCSLPCLGEIRFVGDPSSSRDVALRAMLPGLLEALATAAPQLAKLDLDIGGTTLSDDATSAACVEVVAGSMRRLRKLSLYQCSADSLSHLATLPELESLAVYVVKCSRGQGECKCEEDVAAFKEQCPGLRTQLVVHRH